MNTVKAIKKAVAGKEKAYKWLFINYNKIIANYIRVAFRFNSAEVEDIVQETFIKAFKSLDNLKEPDKFKSWLFTIAKNQAINLITKRKKENNFLDDFLKEFSISNEENINDIQDISQLVRDIINSLEEGDIKKTIKMYYIEGDTTVDKLAEYFNTNRGTITARLKRFRDSIKSELTIKLLELHS